MSTTAAELIQKALSAMQARGREYDQKGGERSAAKIAQMWSIAGDSDGLLRSTPGGR